MTSVIEKNSKDYNPYAATDFEAYASYETPQMTEDDLVYSEAYRESFTEDALRQAYGEIYGDVFGTPAESDNDITSMEPNTEFVDENGNTICGATTLYSL